MTHIWVTIDEWLVIGNGTGHGLVTAGLSGCVAVALVTSSRCLLAHVFSACELKTWRTYKPKLMEMVRALKDDGEKMTQAALVYSDDKETERVLLLRGLIYYFENLHPTIIKATGCIVSTYPSGAFYRPRGQSRSPPMAKITALTDTSVARLALKSHDPKIEELLLRTGRLDTKQWSSVSDPNDFD
jgi:hypothetical protein